MKKLLLLSVILMLSISNFTFSQKKAKTENKTVSKVDLCKGFPFRVLVNNNPVEIFINWSDTKEQLESKFRQLSLPSEKGTAYDYPPGVGGVSTPTKDPENLLVINNKINGINTLKIAIKFKDNKIVGMYESLQGTNKGQKFANTFLPMLEKNSKFLKKDNGMVGDPINTYLNICSGDSLYIVASEDFDYIWTYKITKRSRNKNIVIDPEFKTFFKEFQDAISKNNFDKLCEMTNFPVKIIYNDGINKDFDYTKVMFKGNYEHPEDKTRDFNKFLFSLLLQPKILEEYENNIITVLADDNYYKFHFSKIDGRYKLIGQSREPANNTF